MAKTAKTYRGTTSSIIKTSIYNHYHVTCGVGDIYRVKKRWRMTNILYMSGQKIPPCSVQVLKRHRMATIPLLILNNVSTKSRNRKVVLHNLEHDVVAESTKTERIFHTYKYNMSSASSITVVPLLYWLLPTQCHSQLFDLP